MTLSCVGAAVLLLAASVVSYVVNGWALSVLWTWFVSPVFSVAPLSIPQAIGFSIVVGVLTHQSKPKEEGKETSELIAEILAYSVFSPPLIVFIGWVVFQFV